MIHASTQRDPIIMSDDTFSPQSGLGPGPRIGRKQSVQPPRNISLTPEIIAMGITDIAVRGKDMMIRYPDGIIIAPYYSDNLTKTEKLAESRLAEFVGKPGGLPDGFNPKSFAGLLVIALYNDLEDQFREQQQELQQGQKRTQSILDEIKAIKDEHPDLTFEDWQKILIEKFDNLKYIVNKKLPNIWAGLEFGLSNLRILNIDDCTLPMIGILLGRPGSGKTVPITMLSKWIYGYYTDDFSPKAWVTHTTSVDSPEELALIDMLAKVKDHQFQTPELATLFGLKEDDLRLALSRITRIADGHGFFSDSGVYGRRGYGDIMFAWLGAVVDIPHHAYKVMSSLGPRLYFFRLPFVEVTAQDLFLYLTDKENFNSKYKAIEEALFDYLKWFEIGPTLLPRTPKSPHLRKIEWNSEKNDVDAMQCISNLGLLLGYLRREGRAYTPDKIVVMDTDDEKERKYSYFTGEIEDIKRAGQVLTNLARGCALITGRNYITMDDVKIVVKTVLSTARIERVKAFIALLDAGTGWITREELADSLNVSPATAYRLMIELMAIGLVDVELTNDIIYTKNNHPANVRIMFLKKDKFEWFLSEEFKQLRDNFTPVDNRKFMREPDPEIKAAKAAAAVTTTTSPDDDTKKKNNEKLKGYDASQAKIRTDAAKMKRSGRNSEGNDSSSNNNKRSK
jgi:AAA lid domain